MPSSCTSTSPDLALCAGAAGPLDLASAQAATAGAATTEEFDALLDQAGTPAGQPAAEPPTQPSAPALSAEQLAFLAAWAIPAPQIPPAAPALDPASLAEGDVAWMRSDGSGKSIPQLLSEGVERISYSLGTNAQETVIGASQQPAPGSTQGAPTGTAAARSTETAAQTADPAAARQQSDTTTAKTALQQAVAAQRGAVSPGETSTPNASAAGVAPLRTTEAQALAVAVDPTAVQATAMPRNSQASKSLRPGIQSAEKFASLEAKQAAAGGLPPSGPIKIQSEAAALEKVETTAPALGTSAANWGKLMPQDTRNTLDLLPQPGSAGAVLETGSTLSATPARSEGVSQPASQAVEMVREIREIADGLSQVERNSVEVEFDFGSRERLSVRVEYRDGVVQATFKTDSAELRDAIAREWRQSAGNDSRPYRVADPVFTSSGFSFSGDASRHQRSQEQAVPFQPAHAFAASRGGSVVSSSPIPTTPVQRPAGTGHLHAIV